MTTTARKPTAKQLKTAALAAREERLQVMAKNLDMKLLKHNATRCAFANDDEVYIYDLDARYPLGRSWTPGRCLATLNRKDSDTATIEALGCLMVPDEV